MSTLLHISAQDPESCCASSGCQLGSKGETAAGTGLAKVEGEFVGHTCVRAILIFYLGLPGAELSVGPPLTEVREEAGAVPQPTHFSCLTWNVGRLRGKWSCEWLVRPKKLSIIPSPQPSQLCLREKS